MRHRAFHTSVFFASAIMLLITASQAVDAQPAPERPAASHLYFFTNDGCAPCRQVEPAIDALHDEGYPVTSVNISQQPQVAARFQVDRTPTVILVTGDRMTGRHAGQIDLPTLREWFAAVGQSPSLSSRTASPARPSAKAGNNFSTPQTPGTKVVVSDTGDRSSRNFTSPTMHQGTTRPANDAEAKALAATVRLKVEDPEGISYATGTVIHSRPGEALVLTCGHVFRDANGKGVITAEYGFDSGQLVSVPGQLIHYDAKARDIGLVSIQTRSTLTPIPVAFEDTNVARGDRSFSIGCDHGETPTIRHTAIKNRAAYDGQIKYDIFGRPVDGRSGGGLFTENGELIGVCNAAAVEVDEGIYSGLDTIYWQFAQANVGGLFTREAVAPRNGAPTDRFAARNDSRQDLAQSLANQREHVPRRRIEPRQQLAMGGTGGPRLTPAADQQRQAFTRPGHSSSSDMEVIILVRSKTDPTVADTITVADPSSDLLEFLGEMGASANHSRRLDVAQLRKRVHYPANSSAN